MSAACALELKFSLLSLSIFLIPRQHTAQHEKMERMSANTADTTQRAADAETALG